MMTVAVCFIVLLYVVTMASAPHRRVYRDDRSISLPGMEGDGVS